MHRVEAAIAAGFCVNAVNSTRGDSLLHIAAHKSGDIHCVSAHYVALARLALAHGGSPNARNHRGETPVFLCARYGTASVLRELLAGGGDVNIPCASGESPLLALVWGKNRDAEERLRLLLREPSLDLSVRWRGRTTEEWAHVRDGGRCIPGGYRTTLLTMIVLEVLEYLPGGMCVCVCVGGGGGSWWRALP